MTDLVEKVARSDANFVSGLIAWACALIIATGAVLCLIVLKASGAI